MSSEPADREGPARQGASRGPVSRPDIVPALGYDALTRLYDPVAVLVSRERTFKPRLIRQAGIRPGHRVLDLACGTGTLLVRLREAVPGARAVGLDADPRMVSAARRKARKAGVDVSLQIGLSHQLPYADGAFHRVLTSLFLHHLSWEDKLRTLEEVRRVLRPGGEIHVADWGEPRNAFYRIMFFFTRMLDGLENTRAHAEGRLAELLETAGFRDVTGHGSVGTVAGTLALYSGREP